MQQQNGWRSFTLKNGQNNIILTIFTPAYNRAHTLLRTYESMCRQKNKNFIWMIIDDGSSDNTKELVESWIKRDNGFEIQYIYKENGGMHTAHNTAYANIKTELNTCIDSDDCLTDDAVELILNKWEAVREKGYAGIVGYDIDMNTGKVIGKDFPNRLTETTLSGYYEAGGSGDKKQVYRTDVINQYPKYPVFEGEKYVSLSYKYLLIDQDYRLAVLNKPLVRVDYQEDGSSNSMLKQYLKNPKGFAFWRTVKMKYDKSWKRMIMDCIHYCSSSQIAGNKNYIKESPKKVLTILCTPLGWLLTQYIKRNVKA